MTSTAPLHRADGDDGDDEAESDRLVGSDRVLAVLTELAAIPADANLDLLAARARSPKATVHRALAFLKRDPRDRP